VATDRPIEAEAVAQKGGVYVAIGAIGVAARVGWLEEWLGLREPAALALGILLIAAILWISEAVPLFVTSFAIAFLNVTWLSPALDRSGEAIEDQAFLSPFFSNVILLFLGGFVLSAALRKYLIDERLARWVLARTGSAPSRVLLGIMIVSAFLSMWMSNTATTAMMLALALALLSKVEDDDPFQKAVLLGIPFAANIGGLATPIGSPPNAIAIRYMEQSGMGAPGFGQWLLLSLPVVVVVLAAAWFLLKRLFPARVEEVSLEAQPHFDWTRRSRFVVAVTIITALGWLTSDFHPLTTGTVGLIPVILFFGLRLLEVDDFRSLSWDVLFIVGGGLSLGVAVEASGLGEVFVSLIPTDAVGAVGLLVILSLVAAVMTSVMSNTATANLVIPVVIALSGVSVAPLLMAVAYACSLSMALPVSTPPNAMAFSAGILKARDMAVPGLVISIIGLVTTWTLGLFLWKLAGL